ncbi:restriction endonuclease subunit S domain-containing protein [Dysosmobacter welbionis]|uniref:hypothetical protein n=1 Tax=Dysosmobacter welbionis TaxID=2093857 RepID=UPI00235625EA|nr:hypothetical protein [Dysosmobacter welbionis]
MRKMPNKLLIKHINQQDVKNVAIKLPIEEQAEIVRIVDILVREQQAKEAAEGVLEKIDLIKSHPRPRLPWRTRHQ